MNNNRTRFTGYNTLCGRLLPQLWIQLEIVISEKVPPVTIDKIQSHYVGAPTS